MSAELTAAFIGAASGILGTIVGAVVTASMEARKAKLITAFSLHQEFHTGELMSARVAANTLLRECWGQKLSDIDEEYQDEANCVWLVMNFYGRLHHAITLDQIEMDHVPTMFGDLIVWWWVVHLEGRLDRGKWTSYDLMERLHAWLERFCRGSVHESAFHNWVSEARKCKENYSKPKIVK